MKGVFVLIVVSAQLALAANPNYSYHVKIDDPAAANFQEKAESRKGEYAEGFYSVLEPNGAVRTVSYVADEWGFNPQISYSYPGLSVHSSIGSPALVTDKRIQIVDKNGLAPVFPQQVAVSAPVQVATPVRVVAAPVPAPARLTAAPVYQSYAPAYLSPAPVVVQQQNTVIATPVVAAPVKTLAVPPPVVLSKPVQVPAIAIAEDSYAVAPVNTVTDPNAQTYPDAIKVVQTPVRDYGPPNYIPPAPLAIEAPVTKLVSIAAPPPVEVIAPAPLPPPVRATYLPPAPVAVAAPAVAAAPIAVAAPVKVVSPYASAIGYSTYSGSADSYGLSYGTPGFQVTSSRKFNKGLIAVAPQIQKQVVAAPQVYAPQVQYAAPVVAQAPIVKQVAVAPPPQQYVQYAAPAPIVRQTIAVAPPPPQVVQYAAPPQVQYGPPQVQVAATPPALAVKQVGPVPGSLTGGKNHPLVFSYGYNLGSSSVSHSYAGSGW